MRVLNKSSVALLALLTLVACSDAPDSTTEIEAPKEGVIATVNGVVISEADRRLHIIERRKQGKIITPAEVTDELINLKLIVLQAQSEGYDQLPEVQTELRREHDTVLANLFINERVNAIEISDSELEDEYEKQLKELAAIEYNASHILSETREDSLAALERLEDGDEFGRVASEASTGPSAENGGELGWFRPEAMVAEFSAAVTKLDKGDYTDEPVKSSFGWHIIRLNDKRDIEHPPLDKVRDEVRQLVINNRLNVYVQSLRKAAEVEIK